MKMKLHTIITASVLTAGLLCSCSRESMPTPGEGSQFLMLSPAVLDIKNDALATRSLSEDDLKDDQFNENKVTRLDVFFFKADGTFVKDYHIDGLTPAMIVQRGGKEGYLLSSDWKKDGLDQNINYKVYVVANSTNPGITTEGATTTEAGLKALYTEDANIYKRYKEGATGEDLNTYSADKTFLMNAVVDSWTIQNMATQLVGDDQLVLQRAAVKFVVDVSLSDAFKARLAADNVEYGTPSWKYLHFNTVTPELPDGTAEPEVATLNGGYLTVVPGAEGHFVVTTYAYPQGWTADKANDLAPAILLSYPAVDNTTHTSNYHYYYIPLCPSALSATERNKLYKANAVISSYGSFETLTNDPVNLTYEVKDWTATEADVNAYAMDYLLATPTRYSFKGGNVGEYLSKTFHYYASGTVTIDGIRAYYRNRDGQETTVNDGYTVSDPSNGVITVTSTVPTNGTFRTLEFTVHCADKSEKVIIRHYPADFVTGISSKWCSYDDSDWAVSGTTGKTYSASGTDDGNRFRFYTQMTREYDYWDETYYYGQPYFSRIVYNGGAYYMNSNGQRTNTQVLSSVNNQMYVLQITSANDQYRIGRPTLTTYTGNIYGPSGYSVLKTKEYYRSDDDVISPAFMLASQITSLMGIFPTVETAALHCALYKEVDEDGYAYTGWRLPTKQEIQYMIDNQNTNTQVMIEVLTGHYYWTLDGGSAEYEDYTGGNATFVRCVRDVTAEEIARLNQF